MNNAASDPEGERVLREAIYGVADNQTIGPACIDRNVRCSIYDSPCINPAFCNKHDACCAGDPDCEPATGR